MLTGASPDKPSKGFGRRVRPAAVTQAELSYAYIDEAPPVFKRKANTGIKVAAMLDTLEVGKALRVNRREDTMRSRITDYRKVPENQSKKFVVREEARQRGQSIYWSKVWRVA
jgi:hypothetical protein